MTFSKRTQRRWIRRLALGLSVVALGAVAVPGASGSYPDYDGANNGAVTLPSAQFPSTDALPSAQFPTLEQLGQFRFDGPETQPVRPDDRGARPPPPGSRPSSPTKACRTRSTDRAAALRRHPAP
jgi:hypothetical protein